MVYFGPAKNRERGVSGSLTSVILSFPLFRKKRNTLTFALDFQTFADFPTEKRYHRLRIILAVDYIDKFGTHARVRLRRGLTHTK